VDFGGSGGGGGDNGDLSLVNDRQLGTFQPVSVGGGGECGGGGRARSPVS
jgi:hypothetical protein